MDREKYSCLINLARAIIMSDDEENNRKCFYGVYDIEEKDRLVGVFNTLNNLAKGLNIDNRVVRKYVCQHRLLRKRLRVEKILEKELDK